MQEVWAKKDLLSRDCVKFLNGLLTRKVDRDHDSRRLSATLTYDGGHIFIGGRAPRLRPRRREQDQGARLLRGRAYSDRLGPTVRGEHDGAVRLEISLDL